MKRKILISLLVLVLVFICANIVSYVCTKKSVIEYVFQKEEKMDEVWDLMEDVENQTAVIDDYTITMEKYLYDETNYKGYVLFSVRREGHDMRKEYGEDIPGGYSVMFCGGRYETEHLHENPYGRFLLEEKTYLSGGSSYKYTYKKEKDVMYIYYEFEINMPYGGFKGEISLFDRKTGGEDWDNEEFPLFIYQLKDNVNSEVYEFDYKGVKNHIFISPFLIKIIGRVRLNNNIEEMTIFFKDGTNLKVVENLSWSEYRSDYSFEEGYRFDSRLKKIINPEEIEKVVINGESLKKLSEEEREKVEKAYGKVIGDE